MTIELKKLCINNFFFIEGTKLYCPPSHRAKPSPPTYNNFVSTNLCKDRTFGDYPPFLNLRLIQGTFLLNCTNLLISQIFHQKIALPRAITNWKFWPSTFLLWGGVAWCMFSAELVKIWDLDHNNVHL